MKNLSIQQINEMYKELAYTIMAEKEFLKIVKNIFLGKRLDIREIACYNITARFEANFKLCVWRNSSVG